MAHRDNASSTPAIAALVVALSLGTAASAQSPAKQCMPGAGTNANGTCITYGEHAIVQSGVNRNISASQFRENYNWPAALLPSGDSVVPKAKDTQVFDQGPNGVASSPGGAASDMRFKRDITPVALLDNGITLYSFRYFWSDQVYVGVMAQQVADIVPDAVERHANGYYWVDYDRLGLKMRTIQEWQADQVSHLSH